MVSITPEQSNVSNMDIIEQQSHFEDICEKLKASDCFALDLEFIPERNYQPVICLVQIATRQQTFIVDPLKVKDLSQLWKCIADPNIQKVLHAASADLDLMYKASSLLPMNVFDTQIAAGFAGLGFPM